MVVIKVLSTSSIILGLYILAALLFQPTPTQHPIQQFHLGCFLTEHNTSHYNLLRNTLSQLDAKMKQITNFRGVNFSSDYIDKKSMNAAVAFETFLSDYAIQKQEMANYFLLSKATKAAFVDYRNCYQQFQKINFSERSCQNIWIDYQNCSSKLELYKTQLNDLLGQKQEIQDMILNKFEKIKRQSTDNKDEVVSENERKYRAKDKQLEHEQKSIQAKMKIIIEKIEAAQYNYRVAQNQSLNSRSLYQQCSDHRKQFKECEELSAEVRNLGHGSIDSLVQKLNRKRLYVVKIQAMLPDESNMQGKQQLIAIHKTSLAEYKKLHKIFAQIKAKIVKSCGCTQSEQQKLYQLMQIHINQEQTIKTELQQLQHTKNSLTKTLHNLSLQKQTLYKEHLQQTTSKPSPSQSIIQHQLQHLQQEHHEIQLKIFNYEIILSKLEYNCNANKKQLSKLLRFISMASDCNNKRQYYLGMLQRMRGRGRNLGIYGNGKLGLIKAVEEFVI